MNMVSGFHSVTRITPYFSKQYLLLAGLSLLVLSCKKDPEPEPEPQQETPQSQGINMAATPGSWWKYEWYDVDSTGQSTPKGITDSIYVVGDTIINGNAYVHLSGTFLGNSSYTRFLRDSSGRIVKNSGEILFSMNPVPDTVSVSIQGDFTEYIVTSVIAGPLTVPAGTFSNLLLRETHLYKTDGSPWPCGSHKVLREYFVEGTGIVFSQIAIYGQLLSECDYLEKRLVDYYIAP